MSLTELLKEVGYEVDRSTARFGLQEKLDDGLWLAILSEELGEVARNINEHTLRNINQESCNVKNKRELIQVAAMAVKWIQAMEAREK